MRNATDRMSLSGAFRTFMFVVLAGAAVQPAEAATSRWSSSNNRIYVEGGGSMSLTDISATTPSLPATALQHDAASRTWLLTANIIVKDGSRLDLTSADIAELRLQSNASSAPATDVNNFISITADAGEIHIQGVKITSWDTGANAPDTNYADGRAFIRARSSINATTGVPAVSRMDVIDSDVGYLGWEASESYGLSWKANGDLAVLDVLGNVTGSHIHHNYYGIYTFGLQDGQWKNNEVDHNVGYGFDAHDDSDNLVIDNNNVHENGVGALKANHGIILSERCDNAQITNNTSSGNGGVGIFLHDQSDNATISKNTAANNGDAGVAVFCSNTSTIKDNTLTGNLYGVRLSVAANGNTIQNNTIAGSTSFGVFMYQGTDSNGICGSNLVPTGNNFTGNTIGTSTTNGVKISEGNQTTWTNNTFNDGLSIKNAALAEEQVHTFVGNTFASGVVMNLDGSATTPVRAIVSGSDRLSAHVDTGATVRMLDETGSVFDLVRDIMVDVTGTHSQIDLTADNATTDFVVDKRPLNVTTDGSAVHVAPTLWETSGDKRKTWIVRADVPTAMTTYVVGDLTQGVSYDVSRGTTKVGTYTADSAGAITLQDAAGSDTTQTYTLTKSAVQPQASSGGGDGGGALNLGLLGLLMAAGLVRRRR